MRVRKLRSGLERISYGEAWLHGKRAYVGSCFAPVRMKDSVDSATARRSFLAGGSCRHWQSAYLFAGAGCARYSICWRTTNLEVDIDPAGLADDVVCTFAFESVLGEDEVQPVRQARSTKDGATTKVAPLQRSRRTRPQKPVKDTSPGRKPVRFDGSLHPAEQRPSLKRVRPCMARDSLGSRQPAYPRVAFVSKHPLVTPSCARRFALRLDDGGSPCSGQCRCRRSPGVKLFS